MIYINKLYSLLLMKSSILVGGQAVIEGVMMRVPGAYATSVIDKNGEIKTQVEEFQPIIERKPQFNVPIVRGAVGLYEAMKIGFKTLQWSSDIAYEEESQSSNKFLDFLMTALAILFSISLFIILPLAITTFFFEKSQMPIYFNLLSGGIRIIIFLIYLFLISLTNDAKRLFQFHGAEHKAIYVFENGLDLIPSSATNFPTQHPRCGTSFMFIIMIVAILTFSFIDYAFQNIFGFINIYSRIITHIIFIPLVSGFGYEILKLSAKESGNIILKILTKPGIWLQHITTKQPSDEQLSVAFMALKSAFGDRLEKYKGKKHIADAIG